MARKARSPVALFRKLLLVALVLVVVGIVGLFMFGKAGQRRDQPTREDAGGPKGMTLIGEDFDYTFTDGARPVFHIKGESIKADREGTIYLDRVAVTLWDRRGRIFHVESHKASFNRTSNEGQLQGNVVLRGPDELELHTARLNLQQKGDVVVSEVPVEIHYGGKYIAHAGRLDVDIPGEVYTLRGGARVDSLPGVEPPVLLTAQRLIYDRQQHWLRAEGNTFLRRGLDHLAAVRIYGNLSDDEKALKFVHAFWEIEGETHSAAAPAPGGSSPKQSPQPTTVRFKGGKDLSVVFAPQGNEPRRVEFEAPDAGRVQMDSAGGGIARTLTARRIEGTMENGVLNAADAVGGVEIREVTRVDGKPVLRQANGQRGSATFKPDGQLATMDLTSSVVYHDGQVTATGDHGTLDMEQGRGEFAGAPVVVTSDRGRIEAPRMVYSTNQQIVNAQGGVRALLQKVEETALSGTPLANGQGPVHVESQEAFWRQQPSSFIFRGDVHAWRGDNLLLAPELRGDKAANQLTATGGVKTLFYPTQEQAAKGTGKAGAGSAPAKPTPIQVAASDLQYSEKQAAEKQDSEKQDQKTGVLIYTGNVRVDQEGKTITCLKMEVDLGTDRQVRTMVCTGDVKVNDPKVGRKIEGQKAVYQVGLRQVDITGEPVVMNDKEGNQVRGKRVLYYIDDGRAVVQGKEGEANPAPAVMSPQKPAPPKAAAPKATPPPKKPPGSQREQGSQGNGR
jgi:lipopolysaccharide transport protein LptA/LPS export ABC transporter protein LptC